MRKLTPESLRSLYPPISDAFAAQMERQMERLAKQEGKIMKKKLSVGLVMAIVLALLAAGALAAAANWDVMEFLFGGRNEAAAPLTTEVRAQATDGQTTLTVNSALCDGDTLALDWTVSNAELDQPVFLQIEDFTVNGTRVWGDGTDGFDGQWLPGWCNEGTMQDGENVALPAEITGDTLHVALTVGAYQPIAPIWRQEAYDPVEAAAKLAEGYFVLPEGDGYAVIDAEHEDGVAWVVSIGNERTPFTRTELNLSFDVDAAAGRASRVELKTEPSYVFPEFTARYSRALLTPVALYLSVEAVLNGDPQTTTETLILGGSFKLTDGEGNELTDVPWPGGESGRNADTENVLYAEYEWIGLTAEQLPETFSLSWLSDDGAVQYVMPVTLP